ncbi:MAG: hypothetical protein LBQ22_12130 [Bacteroidales bacterium]|jgi:hypothetical protein|nr:hypothetical protein [Bacteroidales bacterium]
MEYTLSGDTFDKIFIDSILFFVGLLLGLLIVCKRFKGGIKYCLIIYTIITFSVFNIFIKPVQDYLIPIPRTFIFYYKIFNSLSIYDIFLLVVIIPIMISFIINLKRQVSHIYKGILYVNYYINIILFLVGITGSLIFVNVGGEVDWSVQIRAARGFLSGILIMYSISYFVKKINSITDAKKIISTLSLIILINFLSEFISSFYMQGISWERGGHSVVFFDQTSALLIMVYLPCLLVPYKNLDKITKITSLIVVSLILYNYIKSSYFSSGIVLFLIGIGGFKYKFPKRVLYVYPFLSFAFISYCLFFIFSSSEDAKQTRIGQFESYMKTVNQKPVAYIAGTGEGGLFERQTTTEDLGEIRAMDMENNETKQHAFQIPVLSFFKKTGIIGIICVLWLFLYSLRKSFKLISAGWYFTSCAIFMSVTSLLNGCLMSNDPQGAFIWGTAYLYMHMGLFITGRKKPDTFL